MSTEPEPEPVTETCAHCGETFDPESEGSFIDGLGEVCEECRHDAGTECVMCEERFSDADEYWSGLILANHEFVRHGKLWVPGFYRHNKKDSFYIGSMIGAGMVTEWALLFAGHADCDLPETYGYVCKDCGAEHSRVADLYYGPDAEKEICIRKHERTPVRDKERAWIKAALSEHPEIMQGHQCEADELEEFWKDAGIAPIKTWSEYTVIDYKGVRVFSKYRVRNQDVSWLTMDSTPKGRTYNGRGVFDPGYLPGDLRDWWGHRHYYGLPYLLKALRHAIDHGHLKDGVMISSEELKAIPRDWEFCGREARREWESVRKSQLKYALRGENLKQWQSQKGALAEVFGWGHDITNKAAFLKGWRTPYES